ncbi:putative iron-sulfur cluster assembly associated protein Nar1 [Tirmania nivea]|nr:putative iron-sulfur cluster assembly associated protein Nar1 [Tirmania nivea]
MSAILSASDLNDFISPGVACIKPVEPLPAPPPPSNPYEVITEDSPSNPQPKSAQISLTDCLACSGCVTSIETVLMQLHSVQEVLDNLKEPNGGMFIALVSLQSVASIATVHGIGWREVRGMIEEGLRRKGFGGVLDTDWGRGVCAVGAACPGFVCYAEAAHPYLLRHLLRMKSPPPILGTFIKSVLPRPHEVYIVGVQPCFDKKLEGARGELTNASWMEGVEKGREVRDVDCVITMKELITLCGEEEFGKLPREMPQGNASSSVQPQDIISSSTLPSDPSLTGTSGGYLIYILHRLQSQHPGSTISITKGRNSDTVEYTLLSPQNAEVIKLARSYGFRNIQNLVRKLKPPKRRVLPKFGRKGAGGQVVLGGGSVGEKAGYAYVEVMACPEGCTNGGGQVKVDDVLQIERNDRGSAGVGAGVGEEQKQREWLEKVDEKYWSDDSSSCTLKNIDAVEPDGKQQEQHPFGIDPEKVKIFIDSWS